ncbi:uncharacterized protein LOC127712337 [Mytilus californianus]|uniref:uncharacterized protein LOC127712337 n=1 Tax=Mytilus californianus TaxID=6549 RepID=UPI0022474BD4|nr:uncharacterized protein LOC127712337 [Mytilus californianus]
MDINICDQCEEEKADRKCFDCNLLYCNSCSNLIHNKGKLQSHRLGEVTEKCQKFCQNCDENEVQIFCEDCDLNYCLTCSDKFHKKGKLVLHTRQQVNSKEIPSIKGKKEWENTTYGWYPVPKSEKCEFFNRLLPDFYQNAWKYMSDPYIFKKSFVTEATRQWDIQSRMKKLEGSVNFILGTNPNAVGSFIHGEILKPGQNKILDNNIKKLNTNYASLDELKVEVKDNECEIYDQTGRTLLKEQFTVQHAFNLQMLILLSQLHDYD